MTDSSTQSFKDAMKAIEDDAVTEVDMGQVVLRPDGYYWQPAEGRQELGPFSTMEEALAELEASSLEDEVSPGESLEEAEGEIGIADWIDPDTGEPAEGLSTPHLNDE